MDDILKDKRFAHVAKDPRFRRMPVGERKVKIDKRFKNMFQDKRFKLKYSVDKRGKPVNLSTDENLKKYYELSDQESSGSEDENRKDEEFEKFTNDSESAVRSQKKKLKKSEKIKKNLKGKTSVDEKQEKETRGVTWSDDSEDNSDLDSDSNVNINSRGKNDTVKCSTDPRFNVELVKVNKTKDGNSKRKIAVSKKGNDINESDEESSEEDEQGENSDGSFSGDDDVDDDTVHEEETKPIGNDSGVDFARGEGNLDSSSSDEDSADDESDANDDKDESKFDHRWGEVDDNILSIDEATNRLAVCNMDWDRMKADDIFVLLNSFKPSDGVIKSVKVYPSEFGKERIAEEATHGPRELKELKLDSDEEDPDLVEKEGTTYHREKLREYQLNRLRYFYAVVECDSVRTADHIYKECDGMEYESSATKLDLRFIPDEETFNGDEVSSVCSQIPANYKPKYFLNAALSQSKVDLTWDETDPDRVQLAAQQFSKKGEEGAEEDLKAYLASSSDEEGPDYGAIFGSIHEEGESEEESDEDRKLDKYKQLLTDIDSQEKKKKLDVEMEISWEPGLREATENLVKKKKQSKNSSVWEDYLQKKKEKKKKKIEERKKKKSQEQVQDSDEQKEDETLPEGGMQAFSDDELPVDEDMATFMAQENQSSEKKKKNKKKKKATNVENTEASKEKAELSLLVMDEEDNKKHFNLRDLVQEEGKKKKKKKQKEQMNKEEDEFQMNVSDPRFSAVFESHLFNIDPSAPEYRKTKGTEAIISEKIKRSGKRDRGRAEEKLTLAREEEQVKKPKLMDMGKDDNLASLIKSVKSKTKHFHSNKIKR